MTAIAAHCFTATPQASAQTQFTINVLGPSSVYAGSDIYYEYTPTLLSGTPSNMTWLSVQFSDAPVTYSVNCFGVDCDRDSQGRYSRKITDGTLIFQVSIPSTTIAGNYTITVVNESGGTTVTTSIPVVVKAQPPPLVPPANLPGLPIPGRSSYESTMVTLAQKWCQPNFVYDFTQEAQAWYYDGARVFFQIADYTGDKQFESCAFNIARQYRDFVTANNGNIPGWRIFSKGLRIAFERTGDVSYKNAVVLLSRNAGTARWPVEVSERNIREMAYIADAHIEAERMGAGRSPYLARTIDYLIGHYDRIFVAKTYDEHQIFMDGLGAEAMINYYDLTKDPRIPPTIKPMLDWMWDYGWNKTTHQLIINPEPWGPKCGWGCQEWNNDLINLVAPAFAWYWSLTGDSAVQQHGDEMFAHALDTDISYSGKIFSQNFSWSPLFVSWRSGGTITACTYSVTPTSISVAPAATSTTIQVNTSSSCAWSAASGSNWISLNTSSGAGSATIAINILANTTGAPRTSTLSVAGTSIIVAQDSTTVPPVPVPVPVPPGNTSSIWTAATPNELWTNDGPVTLGVRFRSDVAGQVTGVRFWKNSTNDNGTHLGLLYSTTGAVLAQAVFTAETGSGWQQVSFSTPVSIAADTTYVAAYFTTSGWSADGSYFVAKGADAAPLHALRNGVDGGNGVYTYGSSPQFPVSSRGANYWVDVLFTPSSGTPHPPSGTSTIWTTAAPNESWKYDGPVTLGVKFRSDVPGQVTGIRFWKDSGRDNGTHVGLLYSNTGAVLAEATFKSETGSGWQQVTFSAPVTIAANTTYVAAYFTTSGWSADGTYFLSKAVDAAPLHALQHGADGGNGVYTYGSSPQFPVTSRGANYWVDVLFSGQ